MNGDSEESKEEPEEEEEVEMVDDQRAVDKGMVDLEDEEDGIPLAKDYPRRYSDPGVQPSPQRNALLFSKYVSFWWLNPLFALGNKRPLEHEDLFGLIDGDQSEKLGDTLERNWEKELDDVAENKKKKPSLRKAIVKTFGLRFLFYGILGCCYEAIKICQPILLGQLIRYFGKGSTMSSQDAFLFAFGVSVCALTQSWFVVPFSFLRQRLGMRLRISCVSLVYKKCLKLSSAALAKTTTGQIVNTVSTDTQKFDFASFFLHYLIIAPVETLVVLYFLWNELGVSALAGIGLLIILVPLQMKMGNLLMYLRRKMLLCTDDRIKYMNEIIGGIKVIKMYTWEDSFADLVNIARRCEIDKLTKLAYVRGSFMAFFFSSSALISFLTFFTYVMLGNTLTAQKVFTCIALFSNVRLTMGLFFPVGITLMKEAQVSIERIQKVLDLDEMESKGLTKSKLRPTPESCEVVAENIKATWNEELSNPTLDSISFKVRSGELLAVVGPTGSGKTSLLMSILGELPLSSGSINVKGRIAYVSQQSWVFNGTIRHNILFGQDFDQEKYDKVITACALDKDFEILADGDQTLVGERGVSLSGGQRARVNLARAVYYDADIYMLDDPLSAVDAHVGRHLFDKCIKEYLSDKPRILVTHQVQYLKDADHILAILQGKVCSSGCYTEVSKEVHMEEDESEDSAVDSESETAITTTRREFQRQMSLEVENQLDLRKRNSSFMHKESMTIESTSSLMSESTALSVYEEEALPEETKQEGAISLRTYTEYFKAGHSALAMAGVMTLFVLCQTVYLMADWWLSYWSNGEEKASIQQAQAAQVNSTVVVEEVNRELYLGVYSALIVGLLSLAIARTMLFFKLGVGASKALQERMFTALVRSPMYFFDTNSTGRILNRFSKDISFLDDMLPFTYCDFFQTGCVVLGILILVSVNNPLTLIIILPVTVVFFFLRRYYVKTSREVKRIEGVSRSPLFNHFSNTLLGLPTIRAFTAEEAFVSQVHQYQDDHTRAWVAFLSCTHWLGMRLDLLSTTFTAFVALVSPALVGSVDAGTVGLTLTYAIMLAGVFQQCVKQSAEVENLMTSVERVLEYCDLKPEAPAITDVRPPSDWPQAGGITMDKMSFSYARGLPNVLHRVTCNILPREKIGVCGRTGAGKSSLLGTLFRTAEPTGKIEIDGLDIKTLGVKDLRKQLSIIPQDPVLFSGSMRQNLDPFSECTDTQLWQALEEVQLKQAIEVLPGKLDTVLAEAGGNFSVGQRQLVCLARAILRHNKILVIDEATANVDPATDTLIQKTIREKFKDCTVLTIAHRLHTIIDSDRVMVLDAGRLREFDAPYRLLKNKRSLFSSLVEQTGPNEAASLYAMAREAYTNQLIPEEDLNGVQRLEEADANSSQQDQDEEEAKNEDEQSDEGIEINFKPEEGPFIQYNSAV